MEPDLLNDAVVHLERVAVVQELEVLLKYAASLSENEARERDELIKHICVRVAFIRSHTKNVLTDEDEAD